MLAVCSQRATGEGVAEFVAEILGVERELRHSPARFRPLAQALARLLDRPDVLDEEQAQPSSDDHYRTVILWADDELDLCLQALVWRAGQRTSIHDHLAACMVGIYRGAERETQYVRRCGENGDADGELVVPVRQTVLSAGSVVTIPPGDWVIHRVEAVAPPPQTTISLHFYEIDVRRTTACSSIRRRYKEVSDGGWFGEL